MILLEDEERRRQACQRELRLEDRLQDWRQRSQPHRLAQIQVITVLERQRHVSVYLDMISRLLRSANLAVVRDHGSGWWLS